MKIEEIKNRVLTLPKEKQVLFCFHMIKRLWPNYIAFYNVEKFGDPDFINTVVLVTENYFGNTLNYFLIQDVKKDLLKIIPHSEDYPTLLSAYALDAGAACHHILTLIGEDDFEAAPRVCDLSVNTVYFSVIDKMNLQTTNADEYSDEEIDESQEMQNELIFQNNLITRLNEVQDINLLVEEAFDAEYESNIGLK